MARGRSDRTGRAHATSVRPRRWLRRRWASLAIVLLLAGTGFGLPQARAAFFATTPNANSFTAAASFPDYPSAVDADDPLFYHRLDEAPGAVTALDSSGNGNVGVHGSSSQSQSWNRLWPMDENTGTTSRDVAASGTATDLTLTGATWTSPGRAGSALAFNGTSHYAATTANAMAANASFTVSAWVYLTDMTATRTAVSQVGGVVSGFELGYDDPADRWAFSMRQSDLAAAPVNQALSTAAPTPSAWTHLMGTFDATNNAMALYVNGIAQTGATLGTAEWAASGIVEIGAGKTTSRNRFWKGSIDDVRVQTLVRGALGAQELTIGTSAGPATSWKLDENTGTSTSDSAGHLNTATLGSAASWGVARVGTSSVSLTGDTSGDSYVAGSATGVDTSTSFTVSAWIYLSGTTLAAKSRVAVSQSAAVKSGFMLKYNHYSTQWQFSMARGPSDDYSVTYDASSSAASSATLSTWAHLVGVHDAVAQTVTLYVNGVPQAATAHTATFNAVGPLQVGRVKEFGAWQIGDAGGETWGPWSGRVDEVRVHPYAMDQASVTATYAGGTAYTSLGVPGALQGAQQGQTTSTAEAFAASSSRASYNPTPYTNPTTYSLECWFRSTGAVGAQSLLSFSDKSSGNSNVFDRRLILDASGRVVAGTYSGVANMAQSAGTYTNGAWHHVVVSVSPSAGIKLYVDGELAGSAAYSAPANFTGYWRWGGDTGVAAWPDYMHLGELDELAVYGTALSAQQVAWHYYANH